MRKAKSICCGSSHGSQLSAWQVKRFPEDLGVARLFTEPDSSREHGYAESRVRDEVLGGELFVHIDEITYVVERRRADYNHYRPHSSLAHTTPAGFAELCRNAGCIRARAPVLNGVQGCGILS